MKTKLLSLIAIFSSIAIFAVPAYALNFQVTDTGDVPGSCTSICNLRQAIAAANGNSGPDTISFNIVGAGVHTIQPGSALPTITDELVIDGTTQPSFSNQPLIELDGQNAGGGTTGLNVLVADVTIKGLIINRWGSSGIALSSAGNATISGNWIGVDSTGTAAAANGGDGILLTSSSGCTIGGDTAAEQNVISGNTGAGIYLTDSASNNTTIKGNYIGTDVSGANAVPNTGGILIFSNDNTIGGPSEAERNIITGTGSIPLAHIQVTQCSGNTIIGNYIGTNAAGTASLTTSGGGILLDDSSSNTITSNLISGTGNGVTIQAVAVGASNNVVQSNLIGTNAAGTQAIPNDFGVVISALSSSDALGNQIGGVGLGNVISGNGTSGTNGFGVLLSGARANNNILEGNYIGVLSDGSTALGNLSSGVFISSASGNRIGGDNGAGNIIANNGQAGIVVDSGTGNKITKNSIVGNGDIGINLVATGEDSTTSVSLNDTDDADAGGNNLLNFPVFTLTTPSAGKIELKGSIDSTPSTNFVIEFFLNTAADDTGYGEGSVYLDETSLTTNASGIGTFDVMITRTLNKGETITATATDSSGNTSEFSLNVAKTVEIKPGGRPQQPPAVAIVLDDATITVPTFKAPKKKKTSRALSALEEMLTLAAASGGKITVQFQVTVMNTTTRQIRKQTSKRNTLTFKNLPAAGYSTSYVAMLVQQKKVIAKTKKSPAASFTIQSS